MPKLLRDDQLIHPTALVSDAAQLDDSVRIGPFTVVHNNVRIAGGTVIESHCSIGEPTPLASGDPLIVGEGAVIRSHSVIYEGSTFGPRLETGHHVTMREGLDVGENLRVGTLGDLQGDATIGDFVRLHSHVFVSKHSVIEDFVWIYPYSVLTNDRHPPSDLANLGVTVERFAVVASMCCIAPGVRIGAGSLVAASSVVTRDVAPGMIVRGVPARVVGPVGSITLGDGTGRPAYPWTSHFHRGYPDEIVASWGLAQ